MPLTSFFLGQASLNGPLFSAGYTVTSLQRVDFGLMDIHGGTAKIELIVEGDVTNQDKKTHNIESGLLHRCATLAHDSSPIGKVRRHKGLLTGACFQ